MVLSEMQVKTILKSLGVPEGQITKELIEDIQMNCNNTVDVITYVQEHDLLPKAGRKGTGSGGGTDKLEGILIASSSQPRLDAIADRSENKLLAQRDLRYVVYDTESGQYVMVDEHGNFITDEEGNAKILTPIKNYIGYVLHNGKITMIKSSEPLPEAPCYVTLTGRNYNNRFFVVNKLEQRELSEVELEVLNNFIDDEIFKAFEKVNKECQLEPFVFIGKVRYVGSDRREGQPDRGELDLVTVFTIGHGENAINIRAPYCNEYPRNDAGIFIGLLTVRKWTNKNGDVRLIRTITHPVKVTR
jgi:hypothetical protein